MFTYIVVCVPELIDGVLILSALLEYASFETSANSHQLDYGLPLLNQLLPQTRATDRRVTVLAFLFQMLPTALVPSWKVGVVSVALHTQHAQQSSCFGNLPRERGLIITWITPTLFTPVGIGSYWMGKEKYNLLSHSGSDLGSFMLANLNWKLPAFCIY